MEAGQGHIRGATELINIREFIQKWDSSVIPGISEADKVYTPMRDVLARELEVERQTIAHEIFAALPTSTDYLREIVQELENLTE